VAKGDDPGDVDLVSAQTKAPRHGEALQHRGQNAIRTCPQVWVEVGEIPEEGGYCVPYGVVDEIEKWRVARLLTGHVPSQDEQDRFVTFVTSIPAEDAS
jgi:hypothetical protein